MSAKAYKTYMVAGLVALASWAVTGCVSGPDQMDQVTGQELGGAAEDEPGEAEGDGALAPAAPFERSELAALASPTTVPEGWPLAQDFQQTYQRGVAPYTITECEAASVLVRADGDEEQRTFELGQAMLATTHGESTRLLIMHGGDGLAYDLRRLEYDEQPSAGEAGSLLFLSREEQGQGEEPARAELVCVGARQTRPTQLGAEFAAHAYVHTLAQTGEDLYVETRRELEEEERAELEALSNNPDWTRQDVQRLLEINPSDPELWGWALKWSKEQGDADLTYEVYRRYRPVGRCSHDRRPLHIREQFASFCSKHGELGCQLRLLGDLMAYRVQRVSDLWRNGKPVSYESPVAALAAIVEVEPYLIGSLVHYPSDWERVGISPRFAAMAVHGTDFETPFVARLKRHLASGELDPWNAHRFAITWAWIKNFNGVAPADVHARMAELEGAPALTMAMVAPEDEEQGSR